MMLRREFELTPEQHRRLIDFIQTAANAAWQQLGEELGFVGDSAEAVPGKDGRFFTAEFTPKTIPPLAHSKEGQQGPLDNAP